MQDEDDADSALGSDTSSYTTSLASSIKHYKYENGRTYHSYREGQYVIPNDDKEQVRSHSDSATLLKNPSILELQRSKPSS
jgi:hypothetical protein